MDLAALTATEQKALLDAGKASCRELLADCRTRAEMTEPVVNAIPTVHWDTAEDLAGRLDDDPTLMAGAPLRGLVTAFKDLANTAGVRTTYGSPPYANHVPDADSPLVAGIKATGMVPIGKTNTPELGSGSQTFNAVLGTTRNPWDPTRTPGGSSGGATAALACGSVSLADGSDLGGSLRNPASFCGVVGFRPSKGEFPHEPDRDDAGMATAGPMGRTVGDVLLFHDALKGCTDPVPHTTAPRVAYSRDLGGLPVHSEVRRVIDEAVRALVDAGWCVDEVEPELGDADAPFDDLRGLSYWGAWSHLLDEETVKEDVQHELRHGRALSGDDIRRALDAESRVQDRWEAFLSGTDGGSGYDLLVAPVSQVPPFPVGLSSVPEIDGVTLPHYKDWMRSCCRITVTGAPAISVPAGFTADGLPIGLQMAGRRSHDRTLLGHALAAEEVFGTAPAPDIGALATTDPATLPPGPLG